MGLHRNNTFMECSIHQVLSSFNQPACPHSGQDLLVSHLGELDILSASSSSHAQVFLRIPITDPYHTSTTLTI